MQYNLYLRISVPPKNNSIIHVDKVTSGILYNESLKLQWTNSSILEFVMV